MVRLRTRHLHLEEQLGRKQHNLRNVTDRYIAMSSFTFDNAGLATVPAPTSAEFSPEELATLARLRGGHFHRRKWRSYISAMLAMICFAYVLPTLAGVLLLHHAGLLECAALGVLSGGTLLFLAGGRSSAMAFYGLFAGLALLLLKSSAFSDAVVLAIFNLLTTGFAVLLCSRRTL
ncbi:MAG: hypothetical protein NVS9B15_04410 [Acidobacteriaceae bacterium]